MKEYTNMIFLMLYFQLNRYYFNQFNIQDNDMDLVSISTNYLIFQFNYHLINNPI